MSTLIDAGLIALGLILIGASRSIADGFKITGNTSMVTKFSGLGDNYNSRLYRWVTAVITGLVFVALGIADMIS